MSLLINGMNMPDGCRHCRFCIPTEPDCDGSPYECVLNDYLHWTTWMEVPIFVSEGCKLIKPRTPHGRLIDADRLIVALRNSVYANAFFRTPTLTMSQIEQLIEHQPTVIEKENAQ